MPFKHHWRTKSCNITNLCFADDVMLFCNGDLDSVRTLAFCLDKFASLSGLHINRSKSLCFLANVQDEMASAIINILQFDKGCTPSKFLGVPLISSKLSISDCRPLIERITARVSSWTNRFLSFTGRITLVKSVLFAIQAYWSKFFTLPSMVLHSLQSILTRFIWRGPSLLKHGVKVAWSKLALPFSEGGLSIKNLGDWNKASILLHLWQVINHSCSSLWAEWIRNTVIKKRGFWSLKIPANASWIWRKVLKFRDLALPHISYHIGNGRHTLLWLDPWLGKKPLANSPTDSIISNSGLTSHATVADILDDTGWNLPMSNYYKLIELRRTFDSQTPYDLTKPDSLSWDTTFKVNTSTIWESIRSRKAVVRWWKLIWTNLRVPRYSFYMWLAFHKGFKTKDILASYGLEVDRGCVLCNDSLEDFGHLFFSCTYSYRIFFQVMRFCGWRGSSPSWLSITAFLLHMDGPTLKFNILCLGLSASVYMIWQERNSRIHSRGSPQTAATIARVILHLIRCRLHSYNRFRKNMHNSMFWHFALVNSDVTVSTS